MDVLTKPTLDLFKTLDERTALMLIDHVADQLSDDLAEPIRAGLVDAFGALEEGRSFLHTYPGGYPAVTRADWAKWDAYRDNRLAGVLAA